MKLKIIKTAAVSGLLFLMSCDKESCEYVSQCEPFGSNREQSGITVVTYYAGDQGGFVGAVYDTRNNAAAPVGSDWAPTLAAGGKITYPADWTHGKIGNVFGIATDDNANVYLASSGIYNQLIHPVYGPLPYVNANPHRIYKATAGTYSTSPFVDLPSSGPFPSGSLNGIGNIAFDKVNKQFFATNLDDGKIYRISSAGAILQAYDPWAADTGTPDITVQDERIWGIGVNYEMGKVKVYFARVTNPVATLANRNLYSVTLNSGGAIPSSSPNLEIPNLPGDQAAITDIEFSADTNKMIIAERGHPHNAGAYAYNKSVSGWTANATINVGSTNGKNSAGGVDFAYRGSEKELVTCEEFVWASGYSMLATAPPNPGNVYGIQGISYSGNSLATYSSTDLFIDLDQAIPYTWTTLIGKYEIGDVDVIDADQCTCVMK